MLDPQDNTFPIPGADNTQLPAGGSVVPPVANTQPGSLPTQPQPVEPALDVQMPAAPVQPVPPIESTQTAPIPPVAPGWQNQAVADASQLPAGTDNYAVNTPTTPIVGDNMNAAPIVSPSGGYEIASAQSNPMNAVPLQPDSNIAPQPTVQPYAPVQSPPPTDPYMQPPGTGLDQQQMAAVQTSDPGQIPPANTLDLSQQGLPPLQPGEMQPGVAVQPDPNMLAQMSVDPGLGALPPDFGMSNNAMADGMADQQATKSKKPLKFIIIGVVAVAFILILSLVVLFSGRNSRKPAVQLNDQPVAPVEKAQDTPAAAGVIPDGYKAVVRDCFTFGVLLPTTVDFSKTSCQMGAQFGTVSQYNLTITPVTETVSSLQSLVDKAKTGTISTQDDIKLGGVDAKKVILKVNGIDQQTVVVIPANKNYQLDGKVINGFLITTSYNDDTAKKASSVLISSWVWK